MGYGVAVISALIHYINPLAQTTGPGTLMCKSCPSVDLFYVGALETMLFAGLNITWGIITFHGGNLLTLGMKTKSYAYVVWTVITHLGASFATLLVGSSVSLGCVYSLGTLLGLLVINFVNKGPPPGNYNVSLGIDLTHKKEGGIIFGRSKTQRFKKDTNDSPGPGAYLISSEAKSRKQEQHARKQKKNMLQLALSQKPVVHRNNSQLKVNIGSLQNLEEEEEEEIDSVKPERALESGPTGRSMAIMSRDGKKLTSEKVRFTRTNSLSWRRKYVPPSIPKGNTVYGYQENQEGELEPRKPPKMRKEEAPAYLFSFAEKSKHEHRGYGFSKQRERLSFAIFDNPAPNYYDPELGEKYLAPKTKCLNPAVMTLAPSTRITDEIISNCLKKGIPGPGSYDIKAPLAEKLKEPRNRFRLGAKSNTNPYINPELIKIPGPGAYFPETPVEKPQSKKQKPFGSTSKRFQSDDNPSKETPAVGSYEIDEPSQPGPGTYDFVNAKNPMKVQGTANDRSRLQSRIQRLATKGPTVLKLGQTQFLSSNFHVPVFGSQTTRFDDAVADLPPPGAYELSEAFDHLKMKVSQKTPAPGQYNPELPDKKPLHQKAGPFLSTEIRFNERYEQVPGPGSYLIEDYENSLVKKTHNVTLKEQEPVSQRSVKA
ncbi:Sperm-tail PG-rich repeat-containing protein 2 [Boothiomyces macroporosus]|uniref:Sperm-tail PG-rich repeat-containing protein 2 n=1 Tax=Boothiomyces macroporosus TaxID=261099 RepID=A0AAD5UJS9_9FUNG|nr:Sperm-tail PG-rich repeat-containing protein 2 [Boothiomyces macroporosus]